MIKEICIKSVRRFSKLDTLTICFLICLGVFVYKIIIDMPNFNIFWFIAFIVIIFAILIFDMLKQNNNNKKEDKKLFGNDYENKFHTNIEALKSMIVPLIDTYCKIAIVLFVLLAFPITTGVIKIFITSQLDQEIYVKGINDWGSLGDYIGGVFGTIFTFLTFVITLYMLSSQQKQIKMAREEFRQQQFETTTFANKLNDIKEHISKIEKDNKVTKQFYQLLQMTFKEIQEYSNDKIIIKKHADMLKMSLTDDILIKIFQDKNIPNDSKKDNDDLFVNIRNIINKYALFRNLKLSCNQYDNDCYKKYKISAFENNIELMTYRISLETNAEELDKDEYVENLNVLVRQAVAANPNIYEKTLTFLSIDKSKEVRQAVASNLNTPKNILTQLATNDLSDEVRICALGNSNIDKKLLERELKDKYYEIDEHNIEKMAKIIFNNSQIYNDNTKFNKYMMKIISYLEKKYDNEEYDLRNDKKEKIFKYFEKELNDNIYKNIISLSIDNILNYKCPHTCYLIIQNNNIINKIYSYDNNIWQIISNNIIDKIKNQESTARITSVFKEHEKELIKFISQLKNK
ncbi:MAG: hypothetical protein IJ187_02780 [Neisseriaceae bacterium]|nr:hypothetical protein [Neisseriaceae bacterium]